MKKSQLFLTVFLFVVFVAILIGLSYGFGWIKVHQTATIGKEQQNVERRVFEESQSYVEGKRREALKMYKEYLKTKDPDEKAALAQIVAMSFANFDENKLTPKLKEFVHKCKYER